MASIYCYWLMMMVIIWLMMVNSNLVGGWPTPLKNMSSSIGMMTFPRYGKKCSKPPTSLWLRMIQIFQRSDGPWAAMEYVSLKRKNGPTPQPSLRHTSQKLPLPSGPALMSATWQNRWVIIWLVVNFKGRYLQGTPNFMVKKCQQTTVAFPVYFPWIAMHSKSPEGPLSGQGSVAMHESWAHPRCQRLHTPAQLSWP